MFIDETDFPLSSGDWLKRRRKELDLTQAELAGRVGCSLPALRKIESGERRPSKQLAGLLAQSLEIPAEDQTTFIRVVRSELPVENLHTSTPVRPAHRTLEPELRILKTNLPVPLTPLVGRDTELATLGSLLANPNCRLLSITGMGGIGKTRLAIELACQKQGLFPGGVYYVPLASLNSAEFIAPAIADGLGLPLSGEPDPQEQLLNHLTIRTRQATLLVLDNLEHLLAPSDPVDKKTDATILLKNLLQRLNNIKILTTSRERIGIQGEWTFDLQGLPFPTSNQSRHLEEYSALILFLQRARQVKTNFKVLPDEWPSLVRVCQLVEGTPLAIELAASWAGMLSIKEIAQEIESNLDFPETSRRDLPERHRSLRATFDHSWKLLSPQEQQVLRRLAVFRGGFQREAAERVAGASLSILLSLFSKSLLLRKENGRFDLHDVVHQYALSHLLSDPQNEVIFDRHSEFYLRLVQDQEKAIQGSAQSNAIQVPGVELDNLRAAMEWGLKKGDTECTLQIAIALGQFWFTRGYWREGLEWLERGIDRKGAISVEVRAKALMVAGRLKRFLGDYPHAVSMLQESLTLWQQIGDQFGVVQALTNMGASLLRQGDTASATTMLEMALSLSQQQGDRLGMCSSLDILGKAASRQGNSQRAIELYNQALALAREAGDENQIAKLLNLLGDEYGILGDYEQAEACFSKAEKLCRSLGNRIVAAHISGNRGYYAFKKGDYARAFDILSEAIQLFQELGDKEDLIMCLGPMAFIAIDQRYLKRAARLLGASQSQLTLLGIIRSQPFQADHDRYIASLRSQLGETAFAEAWEEGSKMTFDQAINYMVNRPWQE